MLINGRLLGFQARTTVAKKDIMKTKIENIKSRYLLLAGILFFTIAACQKVEHSISDAIVTINQNTVASLQVGQKLTVNFVTNNVATFDVAIVSAANPSQALLSETVSNPNKQQIIQHEFDIPASDDWVGDHLIKVTYNNGGSVVEKTKEITFTESNPALFLVGGSTSAGWEPTAGIPLWLYDDESKTKFEIYAYFTVDDFGFKLLPTDVDWENGFGDSGTDGVLLQDNDAGNLTVPADGFYRLRVDVEELTYELLELHWGVIGSATAGGWDNDVDLEHVGGKGSYSFKGSMSFTAGEYKFRANDDWDINLGGELNNLFQDGPNLEISTPGTYQVELILEPGSFRAVVEQ